MTLKKRKQHQENNQSSCKVTEWAQVLRFSPLIFRFNCLRKRDTCYHSIEHLRWVVWKHRRGQYGKFYVRSWMIVIFKNVSRDGFTKFRKGWLGHLPAITNFCYTENSLKCINRKYHIKKWRQSSRLHSYIHGIESACPSKNPIKACLPSLHSRLLLVIEKWAGATYAYPLEIHL